MQTVSQQPAATESNPDSMERIFLKGDLLKGYVELHFLQVFGRVVAMTTYIKTGPGEIMSFHARGTEVGYHYLAEKLRDAEQLEGWDEITE